MSRSTPEADKPQLVPHNEDPEPTRFVIPTSIVVFFLLLFWPIFFGQLMVGGDALYYSYPLRTHAWQIIKQGSLPLWTSSLFAGYPLFSMSQLGLAYPLTWGYAVLPAIWAEQVYVALPFLLCPFFTYFYLRKVGRSRNASLLGALSLTYGGLSIQTINGYFNHGTMWLPLILLGIESTRKGTHHRSLFIIVGAYAMSILNGQAQAFFYVGLLALLYSLFISLCVRSPTSKRFFPLITTLGGLLLATGLTAFQTMESWWAVSSSIREGLSYPTFVEGSLSLSSLFRSFLAPRFKVDEVMAYVPGLTACLAVLALVTYELGERDRRVLFWGAIAAISILLMLGGNTPIFRLLYHIPVFNLFRVPARHAFEWTFAVSALGAYGWDAVARLHSNPTSVRRIANIAFGGLFVLFLATAAYWLTLGPTLSERSYVIVKVAFTVELLAVAWTFFKLPFSISANLLTVVVFIACFVEASILFGVIWKPNANSVASYEQPAASTHFLRQLPDGRVYTDGPHVPQRFDSFNMLLPYQIENVAGYEPALLSRFSEALGNVGPDTSAIRSGFKSDGSLFEPGNQVLDLLNTRYVTAFSDLRDKRDESTSVDGVNFAESVAPIKIVPSQSISLERLDLVGDTLKVVTSLGYAQAVAQGQPVATLKVYFANGEIYEGQLLAGVHTSEWAHERPDIRDFVPHVLAPIFDSAPGDDKNSFPAYRYLATFALNQRNKVTRIDIVNTSTVHVSLWKLSAFDSATKTSIPIPLMTTQQWDRLYQHDGVIVLGNKHARPRAWLVSKTKLVTGAEAFATIRGRASLELPLADVALVEEPAAVIASPSVEGNSIAKVVATDPNRLLVETEASNENFLVVSDVYYPGWIAHVDGQETPIYRANYLLRGIRIPAGHHRIEMRYTAPGARRGAMFSIISLAILTVLAVVRRRTSKQ